MTYETKLRKVGGSVMVAIPPVVLDELGLAAGAGVHLTVKAKKLVLEPKTRRRFTLDELLEEAKSAPHRKKDPAWTAGAPIAREPI